MTFEDWYKKRIGISVEEAKQRGVYSIELMQECWKASQAAVNTSSRKFHQWYQLNKHKFNYDYEKAKEIYEQENK